MKSVFLFLISLIISVSSYSQSKKDSLINSLPAYYVDNGDTIGIILSIEQAQQIDNDEELLQLLETMKISCDSVISKYVVVVNEYDRKIGILNMKIHKLEEINKSQSELVDNLKSQIENYKTDLRKAEEQLSSKDKIISLQQKRINRLQFGKGIGVTGTIVGMGLFILRVATHP